MHDLVSLLAALDEPTARTAAPAVSRMFGGEPELEHSLDELGQVDLQRFLWRELPLDPAGGAVWQHDVAWALADMFDLAGRPRYAALCRDRRTHEILAAWRRDPTAGAAAAADAERRSGVVPPDTTALVFGEPQSPVERRVRHQASLVLEEAIQRGDLAPGTPGSDRAAETLVDRFLRAPFPAYDGHSPRDVVRRERAAAWAARLSGRDPGWLRDALPHVQREPDLPAGADLSLAPVRALLDAVSGGLELTAAGYLPPAAVAALDERFAWSDDLPNRRRPRSESDLPPLSFLRQHLQAQRLLTLRRGRLTVSAAARRVLDRTDALWRATVDPAPRWRDGFDRDALAVLALLLLRSPAISRDDLVGETGGLLAGTWTPADGRSLEDAVDWLRVEWYRAGIPLGWWERSRGRWLGMRLSRLGRSAAAHTFWSVAATPQGPG